MKNFRNVGMGLAVFVLIVLFFLLPGSPSIFGSLVCKTCHSTDPSLVLIGAAYFSILVGLAVLFPSFPGKNTAKGGVVWAVLLTAALTYISYPQICMGCLFCHGIHILLWIFWLRQPISKEEIHLSKKVRVYLLAGVSLSVVAFFASFDLTMDQQENQAQVSQMGQTDFMILTNQGKVITAYDLQNNGLILNFVSPTCSYCKEQLHVLEEVSTEIALSHYQFVNICKDLSSDLIQIMPEASWAEDKNGEFRKSFGITGYPTLLVIEKGGKVTRRFIGVQEGFKDHFLSFLFTGN